MRRLKGKTRKPGAWMNPIIPAHKVLINRKITKADYVAMLASVEKFTLLHRLAAELWRAGITLRQFEDGYHLQDYGLSKQVLLYMTDFHFERGYDPAKIPPFLPKLVDTRMARNMIPSGRPDNAGADEFMRKLMGMLTSAGWDAQDIDAMFQRYQQQERDNAAANVLKLAQRIVLEDDDGETPTDTPKARHALVCSANCGYELHSPIMAAINADGSSVAYHVGCYWLHYAKPIDIPNGLTVFDPKEGKSYVWNGERWVATRPVPAATAGKEVSQPAKAVPDSA